MAYDWASGNDGKASFKGTDMSVTGWSYSEGGDDADTTHTNGDGVKTSQVITKEYTGNCDAIWDKDAPPTDIPCTRGETGALLLYTETGKTISFATVEVLTFEVTSVATDVIRFTITWKARVAPTYPA